jgi:hypothetical protein
VFVVIELQAKRNCDFVESRKCTTSLQCTNLVHFVRYPPAYHLGIRCLCVFVVIEVQENFEYHIAPLSVYHATTTLKHYTL